MSSRRRYVLRTPKVMMLGDVGVGKSAITVMFLAQHFAREYDPTIEDSYRKRLSVDRHELLLELLDAVVDSKDVDAWSALCMAFLKQVHGVVLVYSITSRPSFDHIDQYYKHVRGMRGGDDCSFLLLGNKRDMEQDRQVTEKEGREKARSIGAIFAEVSAKEYPDLDNCFRLLLKQIVERSGYEERKRRRCTLL